MSDMLALENTVLWDDWRIGLPLANQERNDDGSWSAWGEDWAVDVHIIEFSPKDVVPTDAVDRALASGGHRLTGDGWVGATELLVENDGQREVFRLAGTLAAPGTLMSCWVSYFRPDQQAFALSIIQSVAHSDAT